MLAIPGEIQVKRSQDVVFDVGQKGCLWRLNHIDTWNRILDA